MAPTFVDLFCGIGGFRIGLEAAGFECVYANDIDVTVLKTYKDNRGPEATYPVECADIREVFEKRLDTIPRHHVLTAGFPCQPFSKMGKLLGERCPKYGDLYRYTIKIAAAKRPVAVLLENVDYFFHYSRPWYNNLEEAFKKAGYVCCARLLSADEVGVPQHRRRGFIVAVRADVPGAPFMFPPVPPVVHRVTVRQALLPVDSPDLRVFRKLKNEEIQVDWKKPISPTATWNDLADVVPDDWRTYRSGILHLGSFKDPLAKVGGRLYHDLGHHPCMTTSFAFDPWFLTPGSDKEGMVARKLHTRELCRIQGFPDSFGFGTISRGGMVRQLGNSVPPPMVEWIGRALLDQFRAALVDYSDDNEDNDNGNEGGDEERGNRKETTRLKTGKSRRKSGGSSRSKPHKHSKRHSKRRSKRHKHRSKGRPKTGSGKKATHKPGESSKSGSKSTSKRKLSSDWDLAPPPKRQNRQSSAPPDERSSSAPPSGRIRW